MAQYWFKRTQSGTPEGPFSATDLKRRAAIGDITHEAFVSVDKTNWIPALEVKGLFPSRPAVRQTESVPPPLPPSVAQHAESRAYAVSEQTKTCPYCGEYILAVAIKCKHCGERLDIARVETAQQSACQACGVVFGGRVPYHFYERFQICKRCRNSLINRRAGAYLLDVLFIYLVSVLLGVIVGVLAAVGGASKWDTNQMSELFTCLGFLVVIIYSLVKDGMFRGQSPGKAICGIRVIDLETGAPCNVGDSAKRNLPLWIPFVPLIVAFQVNGGDSSRWGDGWAGTAVVRTAWARLV